MENYKENFIQYILKEFDKFEWVRDNFDFYTEVNKKYRISLMQNRESTFLVIDTIPATPSNHSIDAKVDKRIKQLYDNVFKYYNEQKDNAFWGEFFYEIKNIK